MRGPDWEEPGGDVLALPGDEPGMQLRPDLGLGKARLDPRGEPPDRPFDPRHRLAHGGDPQGA